MKRIKSFFSTTTTVVVLQTNLYENIKQKKIKNALIFSSQFDLDPLFPTTVLSSSTIGDLQNLAGSPVTWRRVPEVVKVHHYSMQQQCSNCWVFNH